MEDSLLYQASSCKDTELPFGLPNASKLWQEMMYARIKEIKGCTWYLDYIPIYGSNSEAKFPAILEKVLPQCVDHGLAVNHLKSKFHVHETMFLRQVISGQQAQMDPSKLRTMSKWPIHIKKKKVEGCKDFPTYNRGLIVKYSPVACSVIDLTKDVNFTCGYIPQHAWDELQA